MAAVHCTKRSSGIVEPDSEDGTSTRTKKMVEMMEVKSDRYD